MTELGSAPGRTDFDDAVPPHGEDAVLVAVQSALTGRPGVLPAARAMSHFGEHSLGWLAVAALGALLQPQRRRSWLVAGAGTFAAHAAAVIIKRIVRRTRPDHPAIAVNVGTPSALSFPSAHATSTAAAAILLGRAAACGAEPCRRCWCRRWRCRAWCSGCTTPVTCSPVSPSAQLSRP